MRIRRMLACLGVVGALAGSAVAIPATAAQATTYYDSGKRGCGADGPLTSSSQGGVTTYFCAGSGEVLAVVGP